MLGLIKNRFLSIDKHISSYLEDVVYANMKCCSASIYEIARSLCKENGKSFNANDLRLRRLLQNDNF